MPEFLTTEILELKESVRARDGYKCTQCGIHQDQYVAVSGMSLDVHRLDPGVPYTLDGCVTLCRPCHHKKPKFGHSPDRARTFHLNLETVRQLRYIGVVYNFPERYPATAILEALIAAEHEKALSIYGSLRIAAEQKAKSLKFGIDRAKATRARKKQEMEDAESTED